MKSRVANRFSLITPTFNRWLWVDQLHDYLSKEIFSQRMFEFEWVIVNDGSTDLTEQQVNEIIRENPKENIKLINLPKNSKNCSIPRAIGIMESTGEFIAPTDDDVWPLLEKFYYTKSMFSQNPQCKLVYGAREDYKVTNTLEFVKNDFIENWFPSNEGSWGVDGGQYVYRASVYDTHPYILCRRACDWQTARNIINTPQEIIGINRVFCRYFWHGGNRSLDNTTKQQEVSIQGFEEFFTGKNIKIIQS
jgi:glycosyltransferase involved in cell wall biosynthesis